MEYSTTKAIVNKFFPGTFRNGTAGLGFVQPGAFRSGSLGDSTGVSLSTNMMLGMALGAVGYYYYLQHGHKLKTRS